MTTTTKPATSFWIISIVALFWNIIGIMAFAMDVLMTPEALQALPEAERQLYESSPVWLKFFYGLAVFSGTLGSIFLLMRNATAIRVFLISLLTILVQMFYVVFMTKSMEVYGPTALVMPTLVIVIAVFLLWYANNVRAKGWIK